MKNGAEDILEQPAVATGRVSLGPRHGKKSDKPSRVSVRRRQTRSSCWAQLVTWNFERFFRSRQCLGSRRNFVKSDSMFDPEIDPVYSGYL